MKVCALSCVLSNMSLFLLAEFRIHGVLRVEVECPCSIRSRQSLPNGAPDINIILGENVYPTSSSYSYTLVCYWMPQGYLGTLIRTTKLDTQHNEDNGQDGSKNNESIREIMVLSTDQTQARKIWVDSSIVDAFVIILTVSVRWRAPPSRSIFARPEAPPPPGLRVSTELAQPG